jgi:hypothetical protein
MDSTKINDKNHDSEPVIMDFGNRKVSRQNFSFITALPRIALINCGITTQVNVKLVQSEDGRYIRLSPVRKGGELNE